MTYVLFDLLWLDGHSLMDAPYEERRARLKELGLDGERWQTPDHVVGHGAELLAASREQGLEGIVAKRLGSTYEPGRRSPSWVKVKNVQRQEVVVGGWLPGEGGAATGSARCSSGSATTRTAAPALRRARRVGLHRRRARAARGAPGAARAGHVALRRRPAEAAARARWVGPRSWPRSSSATGRRAASCARRSYKGLRDDKPPALVVREERDHAVVVADGTEVRLSNPDKVLYPAVGFTKRDVVDYYARVAEVLLPHLEGRPLTLKRYPNGVDGQFFYEKNAPSHRPPWVRTERIEMGSKAIEFVVVQDVRTLAWLANLADLELHTSLSRVEDLEHPTTLAFDLDPGEPATVVECCRVGRAAGGHVLRAGAALLPQDLGLQGAAGLRPARRPRDLRPDKGFARTVAELLEREEPGLVVSRMTKRLRPGKVLVDWSQNDAAKTTVSVYSLRARERPTVSTPVTWDEVRATAAAATRRRWSSPPPRSCGASTSRATSSPTVVSLAQALPG